MVTSVPIVKSDIFIGLTQFLPVMAKASAFLTNKMDLKMFLIEVVLAKASYYFPFIIIVLTTHSIPFNTKCSSITKKYVARPI
mgnify:CR=1 FL=1